jgi:hypothetical protein
MRWMSADTGKEQQVAALCGGQVFELGGTDCNYTENLVSAGTWIWSVSSASIYETWTLSKCVNFTLFAVSIDGCCTSYLLCRQIQPPHPSDIPPQRNEACACGRFLNKEGLESFNAAFVTSKWPYSKQINTARPPHVVSENARQIDHQQSRFEINVHKLLWI